MAKTNPNAESPELTQARFAWVNAGEQYVREVGLATNPLRTLDERVPNVSADRQAALVEEIRRREVEYRAAFEEERRRRG